MIKVVKVSPPAIKEYLCSRENLESGEELGDWSRGEWTPFAELATANQGKIDCDVLYFFTALLSALDLLVFK